MKDIFGSDTGLDEKSLTFLTKALEKSNLPGFDYLEFKQSLTAMSKIGIDEGTAFKSAFATASTVGLTKDKLLKTAKHYTTVLLKEKDQFEDALKNQLEKRVHSKRAEIDKLKKQIVAWQEQIAKLEKQIEKSQGTLDKADEIIQAEMDKIKSTQDNFENSFQTILNQINLDIDNINTYL